MIAPLNKETYMPAAACFSLYLCECVRKDNATPAAGDHVEGVSALGFFAFRGVDWACMFNSDGQVDDES